MKLSEWLVDKKVYIMSHTISLVLLLVLLSVLGINSSARLFVSIFMLMGHFTYLFYDYFRRYQFYKDLKANLASLDRKTLIAELIEEPNFYEGQLLHNAISDATKSMNDEISVHKNQWLDYREYIETWIHEVKTPLAASELIINNNKNDVTTSIQEELDKIEAYVEQALFYARSNHIEKDYVVKPVVLKELIHESLRKYSKLLISKKCEVVIDEVDFTVYTDHKWMVFILGQIIGNSIKYSTSPMFLRFSALTINDSISLTIEDHGIGIEQSDIASVFDKGFVGVNGRRQHKSTGIGLYLCKMLCMKMGLTISISSKVNNYTKLTINFPVLKKQF